MRSLISFPSYPAYTHETAGQSFDEPSVSGSDFLGLQDVNNFVSGKWVVPGDGARDIENAVTGQVMARAGIVRSMYPKCLPMRVRPVVLVYGP